MFDAKRLNSITKEYKSKKIAEEEKRRDEIIESITPFLMEIYDEMIKVAKNGEYNYEFILPQEYTKYHSLFLNGSLYIHFTSRIYKVPFRNRVFF